MQDRPIGAETCYALRMGTITVRLSDETDQQWRAFCQSRGEGHSATLRKVIESALRNTPERSRTVGPDDGWQMVRVCTQLTESERESIRTRTRYHGISRSRWMANVIRAALTREPQFCQDEIEALDRSTFQLAAIGRNLNQIARRLNEGQTHQTLEVEQVSDLREAIESHVEQVNLLVRACTERWAIE